MSGNRMTWTQAAVLAALAASLGCGRDSVTEPGPDAGRVRDGGRDAALPWDASDEPGPDASMDRPDASATTGWCDRAGAEPTDVDNYRAVVRCLKESGPTEASKQAAIARFVAAVEASGGFPIVASGSVFFVYVNSATWDAEDDRSGAEDWDPGRRREPLRVAGDFNAWAPSVVLANEGHGFFHGEYAFTGSANARWRYKLVAKDGAGADVWFSDPLSRRFDFDANGRISIVRGNGTTGHLEWVRGVRATKLGVARDIYLYLPRGYDTGSDRYPVLYMHDGNNLFDTNQPNSAPASWEADAVAESEIAAGRTKPFLIVGIPNNADRMDEYTHTQDRIEGQTMGGQGPQYGEFIVNDLKPLVDARYRTQPSRENTAVLGSSLGGLVSFEIGLEHPGVFKYVGGMSSTFGWGRMGSTNPTMIELYNATSGLAGRGQVFYLDSGGGPPQGSTCAVRTGSDNYCETVTMKQTLVGLGVSTFPVDPNADRYEPADANILHWWEPGAPHSESAWNVRLFRALRLFFRP